MITELIGSNIRKFREELKLSQKDLAEALCMTRPSLSNWENGKSEPSSSQLLKLSKIFKVSTDEILGKSIDKLTVVVVDTSALIKRPLLVGELEQYFDEVIIPDIVISELNNLKDKKNSSANQKAWLVMKSIDDKKGKFKIEQHAKKDGNNDEKIADIAVKRAKSSPSDEVYLLSDDIYFSFLTKEPSNLHAITPKKYVETFYEQEKDFDIVQSIEYVSLVKQKKHQAVIDFDLTNINFNLHCPDTGLTPLITAVRNRDLKMVRHLISLNGINLDERDKQKYHFSAIHHATQLKNIEIIQILNEAGADIDFGSGGMNKGNTPLMIASWSGFLKGADYLLLNNACINQQDSNGFTPLMKACIKHDLKIVEKLIDKSDLMIRSRENKRAIDYLEPNKRNSSELIALFKERQ